MESLFFISYYEGQTWNRFGNLLHSLGMSDREINTEVCSLMTEVKRDRSILHLVEILETSVFLGSRLVVQRCHVGKMGVSEGPGISAHSSVVELDFGFFETWYFENYPKELIMVAHKFMPEDIYHHLVFNNKICKHFKYPIIRNW